MLSIKLYRIWRVGHQKNIDRKLKHLNTWFMSDWKLTILKNLNDMVLNGTTVKHLFNKFYCFVPSHYKHFKLGYYCSTKFHLCDRIFIRSQPTLLHGNLDFMKRYNFHSCFLLKWWLSLGMGRMLLIWFHHLEQIVTPHETRLD